MRSLGYRVIPDLIPDAGPLGGVYTALSQSPADWNLMVACDMPEVTVDLLEDLFAAAEGSHADCVVPATIGVASSAVRRLSSPLRVASGVRRFNVNLSKCMISYPIFEL